MKKLLYANGVMMLFAVLTIASQTMAQEQEAPQQTLIKNVRIFNGIDAELAEGNILVENNLIKEISKDAAATSPEAITINGGGRVVTPGFIDAHTHIALIAPFDQLENEYSCYGSATIMILRNVVLTSI